MADFVSSVSAANYLPEDLPGGARESYRAVLGRQISEQHLPARTHAGAHTHVCSSYRALRQLWLGVGPILLIDPTYVHVWRVEFDRTFHQRVKSSRRLSYGVAANRQNYERAERRAHRHRCQKYRKCRLLTSLPLLLSSLVSSARDSTTCLALLWNRRLHAYR